MINYSTINSCFNGLIGFRCSYNSAVATLSNSLTGSTSGQYVTDISGITLEVIDDARSNDYATLSDYLTNIRQQETLGAMQDFINQHKELTKARHLLDNIDVVKNIQYFTDKVTKSGRFVGIEIRPNPSDNIAIWIRRLGVQFDTLQSGLTLYMFESSQNTAIKTTSISNTKQNSLEWFDMTEWTANYKSVSGGTGQSYYIGYFENDLSGQAINTSLQRNCCPGTEWVKAYSQHVQVRGVVFENSALNGTSLPDTISVGYSDSTFGLHLKMSVTCDITETLCDNKLTFASLIKNRIAKRIFKDYYNNVSVNRNSDMARDRALSNLAMVEEDYKRDLKGISVDFTEIDRFCQPCAKQTIKSQTFSI